ncbi:KH domain protein [Ancylostoma ceylanicum]|uniref:Branchpoint-bridging protein n=1 Tax=Ancylostoma ceylanicum TaxID=53326 RepID=A0A0D6MAR4_9BILA|nr:KH domain protein [Ancylostoma ceylanicum]
MHFFLIVRLSALSGTDAIPGHESALAETGRKRERKSRWSATKSFVPGMPTILPSNLSDDQRTAYLREYSIIQLEIEDATRKLRLGDFLGSTDPAQRLVARCGERHYAHAAPNIRLHDKVWIPQDAHPELNFVGLLIGPRGNTLKSLEAETGAKIIIRGKGSVKEGKLGSRLGPMPGENEPLHAYVTGTDQATIKKACDKVGHI